MHSQKVFTPVKIGVWSDVNYMLLLGSGFRRNDGKWRFVTFCETINPELQRQKRPICNVAI
jgi:hypothetical protein